MQDAAKRLGSRDIDTAVNHYASRLHGVGPFDPAAIVVAP